MCHPDRNKLTSVLEKHMRKSLLRLGALVAAIGTLLMPSIASADVPAVTIKAEGGVAAAYDTPQADRFKKGGSLALKPLVELAPALVVGPSFSVLSFESDVHGVTGPTAWGMGATAELRRPHGLSNTGSGLSAASPWIGGDVQYVRTGPLNRFGWSAAAGVAVPTSDSRSLWVGPFVKYIDVLESVNDKARTDHTDSHTFVAGLSVEFGSAVKKEVAPSPLPPPAPTPEVQKPKEELKKQPPARRDPVVVTETFHGVVQFPYDSNVPLPESSKVLEDAVSVLTKHAHLVVVLEGHASSEGTEEYNQKLSERRAQAVKDYLVKNGISESRLSIKGFGENNSVADNATEAGRRANRRVEYNVSITIVKEQEGVK